MAALAALAVLAAAGPTTAAVLPAASARTVSVLAIRRGVMVIT
jgi:hypothetical protein